MPLPVPPPSEWHTWKPEGAEVLVSVSQCQGVVCNAEDVGGISKVCV